MRGSVEARHAAAPIVLSCRAGGKGNSSALYSLAYHTVLSARGARVVAAASAKQGAQQRQR